MSYAMARREATTATGTCKAGEILLQYGGKGSRHAEKVDPHADKQITQYTKKACTTGTEYEGG
jgi:hypothetical protein